MSSKAEASIAERMYTISSQHFYLQPSVYLVHLISSKADASFADGRKGISNQQPGKVYTSFAEDVRQQTYEKPGVCILHICAINFIIVHICANYISSSKADASLTDGR